MLKTLFLLVIISIAFLRDSGSKSASVFGAEKNMGAVTESDGVPKRLSALATLNSRYMTLLHERRMSDRANLTDASAGQLVTHKSSPPTTSMEVSQSTSVRKMGAIPVAHTSIFDIWTFTILCLDAFDPFSGHRLASCEMFISPCREVEVPIIQRRLGMFPYSILDSYT